MKDSIGVGIYNIIFPISISRSLGIWLSVLCTGKVSIDTTYCICICTKLRKPGFGSADFQCFLCPYVGCNRRLILMYIIVQES